MSCRLSFYPKDFYFSNHPPPPTTDLFPPTPPPRFLFLAFILFSLPSLFLCLSLWLVFPFVSEAKLDPRDYVGILIVQRKRRNLSINLKRRTHPPWLSSGECSPPPGSSNALSDTPLVSGLISKPTTKGYPSILTQHPQ